MMMQSPGEMPVSDFIEQAMARARSVAGAEGASQVRPEHLLLGLLQEEQGEMTPLFDALGLTQQRVREEVLKLRHEA
jgi:ATP-dependent Clp protease ATP-binding subunit ClpA